MKRIDIKTQAELDALPDKFSEYTFIDIKATERIVVVKARENSSVVARENSSVEARDNSSVEAWGNSSVEAWGNSSVVARGNSSVVARENSSVEARGNSSVVARENSSVVARENSSVVAWENSSVVARGNSSVVAWGNSSVEARGNSSVVAWGNSSVEARGNSSVVARENSSVVAWGNVGVHLQSDYSVITLFAFAVCWALAKGKIHKKSKTATVIEPTTLEGVPGWLESEAIEEEKGSSVVLFKRVSKDFQTREGEPGETKWEIGTVLEHPNWDPKSSECGDGKFHACSRPYFCDEFRSKKGDRYIAIEIAIDDLYAWPKADYPHKIAFRKGKVLYECDKFGKKK